jgi:hypothetical protein
MAAFWSSVRCRRWRLSERTNAVGLSPLHSSKRGSTLAVAAVEDLALVEHDRLQEPMGADVGDELSELGAADRQQRE